MKIRRLSLILSLSIVLDLLVNVASAGTLTVTSGPIFTPASAFKNNSIHVEIVHNPPGVTGDLIHLSGDATVVRPASHKAVMEIDGTFAGQGNDNLTGVYSLTIESEGDKPLTYEILAVATAEPIGIEFPVSDTREIFPGLSEFAQQIPPIPISTLHGTFKITLTFDFDAVEQATGPLNLSIQQLNFQLAPEIPHVPPPFRLLDISTRANVQNGDGVLIGGFIIAGADPKKVLLRAIGPSLTSANVSRPLADPVLELHKPNGTVVTNDNWKDTQEQIIMDTGIPPTDDRESAIVATLDAGSYTAVVRGAGATSGVGLVEIYDLDPQPAVSQLANISTRGLVQTGDNVMIGGYISGPDNYGVASVVVRAIGPSLADLGVTGALQDPTLEIHNSDGDVIASNDNWTESPDAQTIMADNLAPADERESALLTIPPPGSYTAIVRGQDNSTGVALVEFYNVD